MILSCHKLHCLFLSHSHKYMETNYFHENSAYKDQYVIILEIHF